MLICVLTPSLMSNIMPESFRRRDFMAARSLEDMDYVFLRTTTVRPIRARRGETPDTDKATPSGLPRQLSTLPASCAVLPIAGALMYVHHRDDLYFRMLCSVNDGVRKSLHFDFSNTGFYLAVDSRFNGDTVERFIQVVDETASKFRLFVMVKVCRRVRFRNCVWMPKELHQSYLWRSLLRT